MRLFSVRTLVAGLATLVVALFVMRDFWTSDAPADPGARKTDDRRVSDLEKLAYLIDMQWTRDGQLPATLSALKPRAGESMSTRDPVRATDYEYRVTASTTYQLCADFDSAGGVSVWAHEAGRACFVVEARPARAR